MNDNKWDGSILFNMCHRKKSISYANITMIRDIFRKKYK